MIHRREQRQFVITKLLFPTAYALEVYIGSDINGQPDPTVNYLTRPDTK